jgi:uncharacterized damage-inducible protein DinB
MSAVTNQAFLHQTMSGEAERFRSVVAALPPDKLDYRHDPRSRSARELVEHLIGHFQDLVELIDEGSIHHRNKVPFGTLDDAVALIQAGTADVASRLASLTDQAWAEPGDFFVGDRSLMKAPRQALAWMMFLDAVHHRGQLSTLIRPMGGKVPAIYGPSADTMMGG